MGSMRRPRGPRPSIDLSSSSIRSSKLPVFEGFRFGCDRAGLVCVLDWLGWPLLKFEYPDDAESEGVWYGLPMPNSAARSTDPVLPEVLGRTMLFRGGGGREVSGPIDGLRVPSNALFCRSRSGRGPGADGVRNGASLAKLGLGKVSERFTNPGTGPVSSL